MCVCVCVCVWSGWFFIAKDEISILVAVHFPMKNIYQLCDYVILDSMRNVKNVMKCIRAAYVDSRKKQRLLSMSSTLRIFHDVKVVFIIALYQHQNLSESTCAYQDYVEQLGSDDLFVTLGPLGIIVR